MNCPNCGTPMCLQDGRECLTCDYCKSVYFPEKNEDGIRVLDEPSDLACPVCAVPLAHSPPRRGTTVMPLRGVRKVSTTEHATYPGQDKNCWGRASGAHDLFPI
jgi:hypothetical protein